MREFKDKDYYDNGKYEDDYDYVVCIFGKDADYSVDSDIKGDVKGDIKGNIGGVDDNLHDIGDNLEGDDGGNIRHIEGNLPSWPGMIMK